MATIERPTAHPNILLVTGSDVYVSDYRSALRDFLYSSTAASSPVRSGTHDFWVTYAVPSLGGGEWAFEDMGRAPRPLRGIVRMGAVPDDINESTVAGHSSVMLQEVGHHWLVPSDLTFNVSGTTVAIPNGVELTRDINEERPFPGPPLIARGDIHWSAYWQSDASPLDGLYFARVGTEGRYARWQQQSFAGPILTPAGLPVVHMDASYDDLDKVVMGVKAAADAYASTDHQFKWLAPKLSAPHPYHAGIFVAFSQFDYIYFGFYQDHRVLGIQRTGGGMIASVDLGPAYHPLEHDYNGVALRIVRRGDDYYFQARFDNPVAGCLIALLRAVGWTNAISPNLDDDLGSLPPAEQNPTFDNRTFRTIAIVNESANPQALGALVKKWDHPHMAELAFMNLNLYEASGNHIMNTDVVPPSFPADGLYASLPYGELRTQIPAHGPIIRTRGGRLHILAPFSIVNPDGTLEHLPGFDHWTSIDQAPKVITKAPTGDFALATSAKVWRTIYTPWAAGYAVGKTVWGMEKSLSAETAVVPDRLISKQTPPPDDTYKIAFIIVAQNRSDITDAMIERADSIRKYWDDAFDKTTEHQRHSNSTL